MSTTRIIDAEFIHIPPPPPTPAPALRPRPPATRRVGDALLGMLGEASLVGIAALAFSWGVAELAFVLLSR